MGKLIVQSNTANRNSLWGFRVCYFRGIQKRTFDPRFVGFRSRKEREIQN